MHRALIIDSDAALLDLHRLILERSGFVAITAGEAWQGVNLAYEHLPTIVIVNDLLPDIPGGVVCACMKNDRQLRHIPTVLIGFNDSIDRMRYVRSTGADAALRIPYLPGELLQVIFDLVPRADLARV